MRPLKQTLEQAVKGIVEAFASEEEDFSIYNITIALRDLINQGWVSVEGLSDTRKPIDLEDPTSEKVYTQEVYHNDVRNAFLKLLFEEELDCTLLRGGKFSIYGVKITPNDQPTTTDVTWCPSPASPALTSKVSNTVQNPLNVEDCIDKILTYLNNKGSATLKQIQSRLKTKGITCEDILESLNKISEVSLEVSKNLSEYVAKTK